MLRKFPSFGRILCSVLLVQSFAGSLIADTIILKTGEKHDAKIIKTTETTVEAEVKMSASITDVRVFQKADIVNIEKPDPAEEAFLSLKAAGPAANSRNLSEYDTVIHTQLNAFVGKYPTSARVPQVKETMAAMKKEKERVAFGEVKIDNIWYTPAELEKQKDQVNATLLYQQMKAVAQSGNTLGALNIFTQIEKTYPGTRAYPAAVDFAQQLIPNVQSEISTKKSILANDLIERKKGMEVLEDFRKAPLIAAAAAEETQANAALDAAIKSGTKWTPIYPRNTKSIEELQKTVTAESNRLASIKTAPMLASIVAVDEANKQIAAGDFTAASASLQKATTLWAANLMIKAATAELTLAKVTPTPTPIPSPAADGVKPIVAETPRMTPAANPLLTPAATPISAPVVPAATPSPKPATPKTAIQPPAPVAEEKPAFLATIPGALTVLGIVALIAGGTSLAMKAKAKKDISSL